MSAEHATPPLSTREYIELEERYGAHNYHPLDLVIERGEGVWVHDVEGRKYMDCLSAYSAVNQGHCHPRILETLREQAAKVTLTSRAFRNDQLPHLYKALREISGLSRALPMNSGAEACETAIKLARKWGHTVKGIPEDRAEVIVFENNFHGRTISLISFSTEPRYRKSFGPFTPGFTVVPYDDVEALRRAITPHTCAVLMEPIQAEAGVLIPKDGYLRQVAALCRENKVLFMVDEIQTGLGRTGKMFAFQHEDVRPDVIVVGKALSGGFYPVSAVMADDAVMGVLQPGEHGSTYGGNPLGCAVARTALDVLRDEKLVERSATLGQAFLARLKTLQSPHIVEVRGRGLMVGIELDIPARPACEALMAEGMLCKETHDFVIRLTPPLVVTQEELDWAFERVKKVIEAL
ncbi:ornithine--oxo-acid transaminase [Comamonas sp. JC664]|uniref:ornithine--oxo-acid transaminase n=1 Tax=Comamonas sp. JC664 TaxID=2801917 RepID=UPI00174C0A6E|nr:ornithine--oxo-acid transaminase [Comamonas sp. JC664]MBL0692476.1 ornithine--oxo-acid transaminase [Comamonas sp. JC664]GHH01418.1 ornithine aminotransferase [Comamonas sp. KCTC 72670]